MAGSVPTRVDPRICSAGTTIEYEGVSLVAGVESGDHLINVWPTLLRDRGGEIAIEDGVGPEWSHMRF
jgi:hypothetical protein